MNQRAEDLLMGAPSTVDIKQLRELNIMLFLQKLRNSIEKTENSEDKAA